jgi:hypothetical protein
MKCNYSGYLVQGFRGYKVMKVKRFEDIEAWQLARELIGQPVMRVYQSLLRGDSESVPSDKKTVNLEP